MENVVIFGVGQVGAQLIYTIKKNTNFNCYALDYFSDLYDRFIELYPNKEFDINVINEIKLINVLKYSDIKNIISNYKTYFIITVPTISKNNKPNYEYVINVLKNINKLIKDNDVILMESSVGIGYTRKLCNEYIENKNINIAFCPERILPDSDLELENISKVISSNKNINEIYDFYKSFLKGEIIKANTLEEAESCKLIENLQRDINIAYLNECHMMCDSLGINFSNVINLCKTKYSWINFYNGMVGGNCIGNNSYFLRESVNYDTKLIKTARDINEEYEKYISNKIKKYIQENSTSISRILFLGKGYKSNATSTCNSREFSIYFDVVNSDNNHNHSYDIIDPNINNISKKTDIISEEEILRKIRNSDIIIINGRHDFIKKYSDEIKKKKFYDYYDWINNKGDKNC